MITKWWMSWNGRADLWPSLDRLHVDQRTQCVVQAGELLVSVQSLGGAAELFEVGIHLLILPALVGTTHVRKIEQVLDSVLETVTSVPGLGGFNILLIGFQQLRIHAALLHNVIGDGVVCGEIIHTILYEIECRDIDRDGFQLALEISVS